MRVMRLASLAGKGLMVTELSFFTAFVYAGLGRFVATLFTYPLMRAKVMSISEKGQELGLIGCLRCVSVFPLTPPSRRLSVQFFCRRMTFAGRCPRAAWRVCTAGCGL